MAWIQKDYLINDIFLDTHNIRLPDSPTAQSDIIKELFSNEDAFALVKSIANDGIFEDEYPVLINEKGKLIVVEGNRRVAAIKAINNPDLVPEFKSKILALKINKISKITAKLAPSRESTDPLIENKHTTPTRRSWPPLRQAYFYKMKLDKGTPLEVLIARNPDVPKFIRMLEMHKLAKSIKYDDSSVGKFVHNQREFPITTLERMYSDENVADYLKLEFEDTGKAIIKTEIESFKKPFKIIVEDIANEKITSRTMNTAKQKKSYIDKLPKEYKPKLVKETTYTTEDFQEEDIDYSNTIKLQRSKKKPKGLIPSSVLFNLDNPALRKSYDELKKIPVKKFPNATHDLLRSFLECSLISFLKLRDHFKLMKTKGGFPTLHLMLTQFMETEDCKKDKNLMDIIPKIKSDFAESYSVKTMNLVNHNEYWSSKEKDVREAWEMIQPLMKVLLNP